MQPKHIGRILTITAAILWGTSFPVIRFGLQYVNPFSFVTARFLVASIILLVVIFVKQKKVKFTIFKQYFLNKHIAILGFINSLGFIFQFIGQTLTTATKAAMLINTNVIFVALISYFVLHEKMTIKRGIGIIIALLGIMLIISEGNVNFLYSGTIIGDAIVFSASILWAVYIIEMKKSAVENYDYLMFISAMIFYTFLFNMIFSIPFLSFTFVSSFEAIYAILHTGILCTAIAFLLWFKGLEYIDATSSSIYMLLEVLTAALISNVFLSEQITLGLVIGGFLLFMGIIIEENYDKSTIDDGSIVQN